MVHHTNGEAIIGAVAQGCHFCTWALREYQNMHPESPISHTTSRVIVVTGDGFTTQILVVTEDNYMSASSFEHV